MDNPIAFGDCNAGVNAVDFDPEVSFDKCLLSLLNYNNYFLNLTSQSLPQSEIIEL